MSRYKRIKKQILVLLLAGIGGGIFLLLKQAMPVEAAWPPALEGLRPGGFNDAKNAILILCITFIFFLALKTVISILATRTTLIKGLRNIIAVKINQLGIGVLSSSSATKHFQPEKKPDGPSTKLRNILIRNVSSLKKYSIINNKLFTPQRGSTPEGTNTKSNTTQTKRKSLLKRSPLRKIAFFAISIVVIAITVLILFEPGTIEAAWWNDSWLYRKKLTFDNSAQSENLTNFPVLVKLTSSNFTFANAQPDGLDIRFTDPNGTLLKYEIEDWDNSAQTAEVWVKVPQIDGSSSVDHIYMYYGNPSASDAQTPADVWDSNFKMVQHLQEDPSDGGTHYDSTSNNNDSIWHDTNGNGDTSAAGKIGGANEFDGTDDYIDSGNKDSLLIKNKDFTISAWVNITVLTNYGDVIYIQGWGSQATGRGVHTWVHSNGAIGLSFYGSDQYSNAGAVSAGQWANVVIAYDYDTDNVKFYSNGAYQGQATMGVTLDYPHTDNTIGSFRSTSNFLDGKMDEIRVSDTTRSADWIAAQYKSMNDTLITLASEEKGPGPVGYWKFDEGQGDITHNSMSSSGGGAAPVGWWKMDEGTDNTCSVGEDACDATGQGNHGTFNGNAAFTSTAKIGPYSTTFDGTGDFVKIPASSMWEFTADFSVSMWVNPTDTNAGNLIGDYFIGSVSTPPDWQLIFNGATNTVSFWRGTIIAQTSTDSVPDNTWSHITLSRNSATSDNVRIYVNGELDVTGTFTTTVGRGLNLWIGIDGNEISEPYLGKIDDVRIYDYARTPAQIAADYANTHGTIVGATWKDESMCVSEKCLQFDGTDDYVGVTDRDEFSFGSGGTDSPFALEAWIYLTSTSWEAIVSKYVASGDAREWLFLIDGGNLEAQISNTVTANHLSRKSTDTLNTNEWYHVAFTYDGSKTYNGMLLYINGREVSGYTAVGQGTYTGMSNTASAVEIGCYNNCGSGPLNGRIDEVKIYPYARTPSEIKSDYLTGQGAAQGSSVVLGSSSEKYLSEGLVGYWKMDESSWNGTPNEVVDSSGNGNHSTATGATIASGKFGNGGNFDASSEYITLPSYIGSGSEDITVSTWVNRSSVGTTQTIMQNGSGGGETVIYLNLTSGNEIRFYGSNSSGSDFNHITTGASFTDTSSWHNITATREGSTGEVKIYYDSNLQTLGTDTRQTGAITSSPSGAKILGAANTGGTEQLYGLIDEVRVYNRALSPKEVRDLYNWAPGPVGYWNFDEKSGILARDQSGNNNDGTLTNMDASTDWVPGKYGAALDFDGANDYVSVSDSTSLDLDDGDQFTAEAWINLDALTGDHQVIAGRWYNGETVDQSYGIELNTNVPRPQVIAYGTGQTSCASPDNISYNQWHHIAGTFDGSNLKIYVDGIQKNSCAHSGGIAATNAPLTIGRWTASTDKNPFDGSIDDVRIYNYARTQKQIVQDMNAHRAGALGAGGRASAVSHWRFDEGYGDTANDSGFGGNNGDLAGVCPGAATCPSWTNAGKFGKALSFDGTDDYVDMGNPADGSLDFGTDDFTIITWIKTVQNSDEGFILQKFDSGVGYDIRPTSEPILVLTFTGGGWNTRKTATSINDGNWHHLAYVWDYSARTTYAYVDGSLDQGTAAEAGSKASLDNSGSLKFGHQRIATYFDGTLDDVKIYNFALTEDEIRTEYNAGVGMVMGASGTTTQPDDISGLQLWLKADAITGLGDGATVATWSDQSGNSNDATQATEAKKPLYKTSIVNGKPVVRFAGDDDEMVVASTADFNSTEFTVFAVTSNYTQGHTFSLHSGGAEAITDEVLFGYNTPDQVFHHTSSGHYNWLTHQDTPAGFVIASAVMGTTPTDINLYLNGMQSTDNLGTAGSPQDYTATNRMVEIGERDVYLDGDIAEILIYNSTLSDADRATIELYLSRKYGISISSASRFPASYSSSSEYCVPGSVDLCRSPVAEWKFDEKTGTSAYDTSENNNTGTWNGTGSHWATGKVGAAGQFNGSDDWVDSGTDSSLDITGDLAIEAWIKPSNVSGTKRMVAKFYYTGNQRSYDFRLTDDELALEISDDGTYINAGVATTNANINANIWQHVAVLYDADGGSTGYGSADFYVNGNLVSDNDGGSTLPDSIYDSTAKLTIGVCNVEDTPASYFNGSIDHVKIFDYARTPAQIAWDYNRGGPVGYWKFDECEGGTAYDASGKGNNGTITVGLAGNQSAPGTCTSGDSAHAWYNGVTGKRNSSLNFDGTDDYVEVGGLTSLISNRITVEAWIKLNTLDARQEITDKLATGDSGGWDFHVAAGNTLELRISDGVARTDFNSDGTVDTSWHHVVATADNSTVNFYIDGKLDVARTQTRSLVSSGINLFIGRQNWAASYFNGQIDEVKIFNYALTEEQIKQTYNEGAIRFGPSEGSP